MLVTKYAVPPRGRRPYTGAHFYFVSAFSHHSSVAITSCKIASYKVMEASRSSCAAYFVWKFDLQKTHLLFLLIASSISVSSRL